MITCSLQKFHHFIDFLNFPEKFHDFVPVHACPNHADDVHQKFSVKNNRKVAFYDSIWEVVSVERKRCPKMNVKLVANDDVQHNHQKVENCDFRCKIFPVHCENCQPTQLRHEMNWDTWRIEIHFSRKLDENWNGSCCRQPIINFHFLFLFALESNFSLR